MKSLTSLAFGIGGLLSSARADATVATKIHELPRKAEPAVMVSAGGRAVVAFNTRSDANELAGHAVSIDPKGGAVELPTFTEPGDVNGAGFVDLRTWAAFDMYGGTGWIATDGTAPGTRKGALSTVAGNAFPFDDRVVVDDALYTRTGQTALQLPASTVAIPCGNRLYGFQTAVDTQYSARYFRLLRLNSDGTSAGEIFPGRRVRWSSSLQYELPSTGTWARTDMSCLAGELFVEVFDGFKQDNGATVPAAVEWWHVSNPPRRVAGRVDALAGATPIQAAAEGIVSLSSTGSTLLRAVALGQARWFLPSSKSFAYFQIEQELWRTDGTAAGTVRIDGAAPFGGPIESAVSAGDRTFFRVVRDGYRTDIWETDGTASGTKLVSLPAEPKDETLYLDAKAKRLVLDDKQLWFLRRTTSDTYAVYRIDAPRPAADQDGGPDDEGPGSSGDDDDDDDDSTSGGPKKGQSSSGGGDDPGGSEGSAASEGCGCSVPVAGRVTPGLGLLTALFAFARRARRQGGRPALRGPRTSR